jgi:hypothetical protein
MQNRYVKGAMDIKRITNPKAKKFIILFEKFCPKDFVKTNIKGKTNAIDIKKNK